MNVSDHLVNIDRNPESNYVLHDRMENRFPFHHHQKGQLTYVEGGIAYLNTMDKAYFLPAPPLHMDSTRTGTFRSSEKNSSIVRNLYFAMPANDPHPFYERMGIYPANNLLLEMVKYTGKMNGEILADTFENEFLTALRKLLPRISTHPLPIVLPTTDHERMQPVIEYIQANLDAPLHLESVSKTFGMSARTLSRLFQSTLDTSFLQYLKLSRMIRAMEQLLQTNKTISEIAYETGYNSIATFSNTFYGLVNVRPSEFQKFQP